MKLFSHIVIVYANILQKETLIFRGIYLEMEPSLTGSNPQVYLNKAR